MAALGMPTFTVELYINAAWTNVSAYVNPQASSISIQYGRSSQSDDGQPGTCSFSLENSDGRFTPDNPTSPYFGYIVPGTPVRVGVTGGVYRFVGRVVSWNPTYTGFSVGDAVVNVTAKDALGSLQDYDWNECLAGAGMRSTYTPVIYARMTDKRPVNGLRNATSYPNKYGQNAFSDFTWTQIEDNGLVGNAALLTTGQLPAGTSIGDVSTPNREIDSYITFAKAGKYALVSQAAAAQPILSVAMWVRFTTVPTSKLYVLTELSPTLGGTTGQTTICIFVRYTTGEIWAQTTGLEILQSGGSTNYADGNWHHIVITRAAQTALATEYLYIDGALVASGSSTSVLPNMMRASIGAPHTTDSNEISTSEPFPGDIGPVAAYSNYLTATDVATQYSYGPFTNKTASAWSSLLLATTSNGTVQLATTSTGKSTAYQHLNGNTVFESLLKTIRGDNGIVQAQYSSGAVDGVRLTLTPKLLPTTLSYSFDIEADLDGSPVFENSSQGNYSEVTATSPVIPDQTAVSATVTIPNSQSVDTLLSVQSDVISRASLELVRSGQTALRISQVNVDVVTSQNSATMTSLLNDVGLLGRLIRITNIPSTVFGKTYIDGYILGVNENITATSYTIQLDLAPVDAPAVGRASDSAALTAAGNEYARAGAGTTMTLTSSVTSSDTSLSITGSGAMLSTNAALYPLDLDVNGERVTVTAAPASSTSPQTVTVTRGVAPSVARAHNAAEPINVWRGCRAGF